MAVGQELGEKAVYLYVADDNNVYYLSRDITLGDIPGVALERATTASVANGVLPRRFKPRGVHWQAQVGNRRIRKFLICGNTSTLYRSEVGLALTIDGVAGSTTGRRGETASYPALPSPEAP